MSFTNNDLAKIAHLARLSLSDEDEAMLPKEMDRILKLVEQLNEIDITGVEPMSHAENVALPFMEDIAQKPIGQDSLKMSRGYEDGIIRVPKIIE